MRSFVFVLVLAVWWCPLAECFKFSAFSDARCSSPLPEYSVSVPFLNYTSTSAAICAPNITSTPYSSINYICYAMPQYAPRDVLNVFLSWSANSSCTDVLSSAWYVSQGGIPSNTCSIASVAFPLNDTSVTIYSTVQCNSTASTPPNNNGASRAFAFPYWSIVSILTILLLSFRQSSDSSRLDMGGPQLLIVLSGRDWLQSCD